MSNSEPSTLLLTFKEIEAPFSSVRVELLAKFSEDPSARFKEAVSARFNSEP